MGSATSQSNICSEPQLQLEPRRYPANGYKPFKEFPDPSRLARAQAEYAATGPVHSSATPGPPRTPKSTMLGTEEMRAIDEHARRTPLQIAVKSYAALVNHLIGPARTEAGKVRAIFVWIATQYPAKLKRYYDKHGMSGEHTPYFYISMILLKQWTSLYVELFSKMCSEAGIIHRTIKGRVKGQGYRIGSVSSSDEMSYNIVFVDGSWRLLNQYWGSHFVSPSTDKEWVLVADSGASSRTDEDADTTGIIGTDDFWFFADPEVFIYSHLPLEEHYQLLARRITNEEFNEMAYLGQCFFELGLRNVSQAKCVLESDTGDVTLDFSYDPRRKLQFRYALYKSAYDPQANVVDGCNLKQYVFMESAEGMLTVRINFPRIGRYKLSIYGGDTDWGPETQWLCSYVIVCKEPDFEVEPNPTNNRDEWGPGAQTRELGLDPKTKGGLVVADQGKTSLRFRMKLTENISFFHELQSKDIPSSQLDNFVRHYKIDKEAIFVLKVPKYGKYIFKISAKQGAEKEYQNVCNYLITSDRGCKDMTPFPSAKEAAVGASSTCGKQMLIPVSHKQPLVECPDTGQLVVQMNATTDDLRLSAILQRQTTKGEAQNVSEYMYLHQQEQHCNFHLNFQRAGMHTLDIRRRSSGSAVDSAPLYRYIVNVSKPKDRCLPFPKQTNAWRHSFELIKPQTKFLLTKEQAQFRLRITRNAQSVFLRAPDPKQFNLSYSERSDSWRCRVVLESAGILTLWASLDHNSEPVELLEYEVLDADYWKRLEDVQNQAQQEADKKQKQQEERDAAEELAASRRLVERQAMKQEKENDFLLNRQKYEEEERRIQEKEREDEDIAEFLDEQETSDSPWSEELTHDIDTRMKMRTDETDGPEVPVESGQSGNTVANRLQKAVMIRDRSSLEKAIRVAEKSNFPRHNKDLQKARASLTIIKAQDNLKAAVGEKNQQEILNEINEIDKKGLTAHLFREVRKAKELVRQLEKQPKRPRIVLEMDRNTFAELSHYPSPPPALHPIAQAALLLLGMDEDSTKDWSDCRYALKPDGPQSINQKLLKLDSRNVHPEIVRRVEDILQEFELFEVQENSAAAAAFFTWCIKVIKDYERDELRALEKDAAVAANVKRQKQIFAAAASGAS